MYADVRLKVDLTPIEERLTLNETILVMFLKEKRMKDLYLLNTKQDGDPIINENGEEVVWTPEIRMQIEAEISTMDDLIAQLTP